jgi:hypothetical protein
LVPTVPEGNVPDRLRLADGLLPVVVGVNAEEWPPQAEPTVIAKRIIKTADKRLMKV